MSLSSSAAAATASNTSPLLAAHNNLNNMNNNRKWILKRRPIGIFDPQLDVELVPDDDANNNQWYSDNDNDNDNSEYDDADADADNDDGEEETEIKKKKKSKKKSNKKSNNSDNSSILKETEIIVQPQLLSVDAFLRTMCDENAYHGSLKLGSTFPALGYGTVIKAGNKSGHKIGSRVAGMLSASDLCKVDGKSAMKLYKFPYMNLSSSLGLMGLTSGLTAYCGVFYVPSKCPQRGETVVVTGAAGSIGSIAVQLCKSTGARVIGIAGGPLKKDYLINTLKVDGVIDYKDTTKTLDEQIMEHCPDGIDFIYDNVGGEILDSLLYRINPKSRIIICGAISQYSGNLNQECKKTNQSQSQSQSSSSSSSSKVYGPSNYLKLAERGSEMKGFNVMQYISRLPFMIIGMYYLYIRGYVKCDEHIEIGLEQFPIALQKLFTGQTIGKTLVRINND
jgi:NADPH-dependent curcumin reductase CurA